MSGGFLLASAIVQYQRKIKLLNFLKKVTFHIYHFVCWRRHFSWHHDFFLFISVTGFRKSEYWFKIQQGQPLP